MPPGRAWLHVLFAGHCRIVVPPEEEEEFTIVVLEGTSAFVAKWLGAECQAGSIAGKEVKSKLCCNVGIRLKASSSTKVAHLCSLPHSFSSAS